MFTGLVQHRGVVEAFDRVEHGAVLRISRAGWSHSPSHGDSIAVNGCCLTVRQPDDQAESMTFDLVHETLERTALGELRRGDHVNLEHAATPQTLLGGHIVHGHIDGVGHVAAVETGSGEYRLRLVIPDSLRAFIAPKGCIAVDGVSLTIANTFEDGFDVALIPVTRQQTTLGELRQGDAVNLESDYLARLVVQTVHRMQPTPST